MKIQIKKIPKSTWREIYLAAESINDVDMSMSNEPLYKAFVCLLYDVQPRLMNKFKDINVNCKKEANLTLKYQEAFAFDWYLQSYIINTADNDISKAILSAFKQQLNQKLQ